ncbi:MAG: N-acetylneuraminate synthase [Legionellales bacterium]|nr:N-acetylneuraminate synthase [Legionellales bacterium]
MSVLIIAEAGVNHNGDINIAKRLIEVAAESGADLVKFQTFHADRLAVRSAPKAGYQVKSTDSNDSQYNMLRRLELSYEMHEELIAHCEASDIGFFSTGFDVESIDMLVSLGQDRFKIPSGEITNLPLLRHIGSYGQPIILSTGMADLDEIEVALVILETAGTPRQRITILHCTTEYPTPMKEVNLRAMLTIRDTFNVAVGYSDHTQGIEVSNAAVSLGASVIEKHFTLDRNLPGPDHRASLQPRELKSMISAIRNIEKVLGDGVKKASPSEMKNKSIVRKSVVAAIAIKKGEYFNDCNITVKRPGTGLSPMLWDNVIGKQAPHDFNEDEMIEL